MIKITSITPSGRTYTCTNCEFTELNGIQGLKYEPLKAFTSTTESGYMYFDTVLTCPQCGHSDRVGHFGLASMPNRSVIHLGTTHSHDHFMSRCGLFTGSLSQGRVRYHEGDAINKLAYQPCFSCEKFEGNVAHDRKLASEEDERIIAGFYDWCEHHREDVKAKTESS